MPCARGVAARTGLAYIGALLVVAALQERAAAMSRHRNMGGWVAETYDEDDNNAYEDGPDTLPINAYVMANFYEENQWYPGTVVDYSEHGYMVLFDGYEDDGAQETDPLDVELVRLPGEQEGGDAAIDLQSFNDLAAEVASVLEGEVTDGDIRAALEASNFKLEAATTSLLDWVAAGKPGGAFAKKVAKKKKPQAAGGATAPLPKAGGAGAQSGGGGGGGKTQSPAAKTSKAGKDKPPVKQKEAPKPKAGAVGGGGGAGTWTVTREMDSLGLGGGDSGEASGLNDSEEGPAFDDVAVPAEEEEEEDALDTISLVVVGHVDAGKCRVGRRDGGTEGRRKSGAREARGVRRISASY